MKHALTTWTSSSLMVSWCAMVLSAELPFPPELSRPAPITVAELAKRKTDGVSVVEVCDYVYGNYKGPFPSPPHADGNPKKAYIIFWKDHPFRFVFSHEASYCPWFELPSGVGVAYQFFEGIGHYEVFNQYGRQERNSFVDIIESGPERVWVRWTYFGVKYNDPQPTYRATEDFWAYPNGLVLRRQTYRTLTNYAVEPIELIGLCPVGKLWSDVLEKNPGSEERHVLAVLDAFSPKRRDVYWTPKPGGKVWESTHRRSGCTWKELDDSAGVAMVVPMKGGAMFCIVGDASGYRHDYTRLEEYSYNPHGGNQWGSCSWCNWPNGWVNAVVHQVDANLLQQYPNVFCPAGVDFRHNVLPLRVQEQGIFYSLVGVGDYDNMEAIRAVARRWLEKGTTAIVQPNSIADLPSLTPAAARALHTSSARK